MKKVIDWIKTHKLTSLLIAVVAYLLISDKVLPGLFGTISSRRNYATMEYGSAGIGSVALSPMMDSYSSKSIGGYQNPTPQLNVDTSQRKVVTESNMSLLVLNVRKSLDDIQDKVEKNKGYVVNTYINTPESGESGYIVVRVPSVELKTFLSFLRGLPVRVVNENISGQDVTDKYVDIEARLESLTKIKARFEEIMAKAQTVDEIMRVQQQINSLQDQIDALKGQMKYMEAVSSSSLITVNLSTDELSLPYAPEHPWRPQVIVKQATRSVIGHLRDLGTAGIWFMVYSVIWIPALVIILIIRRIIKNRKEKVNS